MNIEWRCLQYRNMKHLCQITETQRVICVVRSDTAQWARVPSSKEVDDKDACVQLNGIKCRADAKQCERLHGVRVVGIASTGDESRHDSAQCSWKDQYGQGMGNLRNVFRNTTDDNSKKKILKHHGHECRIDREHPWHWFAKFLARELIFPPQSAKHPRREPYESDRHAGKSTCDYLNQYHCPSHGCNRVRQNQ